MYDPSVHRDGPPVNKFLLLLAKIFVVLLIIAFVIGLVIAGIGWAFTAGRFVGPAVVFFIAMYYIVKWALKHTPDDDFQDDKPDPRTR